MLLHVFLLRRRSSAARAAQKRREIIATKGAINESITDEETISGVWIVDSGYDQFILTVLSAESVAWAAGITPRRLTIEQ
ncbi:hypothetical protein E4U30_001305 [Claviceps sp. LM220 group G6]|nr:hypothetical protein E4U30_001305 [Claviceps sp. LM220 group G6]